MIRFKQDLHLYESIIPDGIKWTSVTTCLKRFSIPFNTSIANKNSKDPSSKWYGLEPDTIRQIWTDEAKRSTDLGTEWHLMNELAEINPIQCCPMKGEWKYAGSQQLEEGVYPEIMLYHPLYSVCGQSDRVEVKNNIITVQDYKTNKKIDSRGFNGKLMLPPMDHMEDCDLNKYQLQLSIYMNIILFHNPQLSPGQLEIHHGIFENEGLNQWGYPIIKRNEKGEPIVKEVKIIKLPYLKKESDLCLKHSKEIK